MGIDFKDYYQVLGVDRGAGADEIKKAYRRLARRYHPDVAKEKGAEERFKEVNEAYEVLGDAENRRKYDTLGANWKQGAGFQPPPGWDGRTEWGGREGHPPGGGPEFHFGGTGFSDFFEQFFGGGARFSGGGPGGFNPAGGARGFRQKGADVEGDLAVSLNEVLQGAVRTITFQTRHPGAGTGEARSFKVRIPAGVREGQQIRVAGKGEPGPAGAGDLFLRVRISPHPDFRAEGTDLLTEVELPAWSAVLGTTIRVPTLDGSVQVKIPPGTAAGQRLRVRGQGLPVPGGARGDLFVTVQVTVPRELTPAQRAAWEQVAATSGS